MPFDLYREQWLDSLSKQWDVVLRSPAFLEAMRNNLQLGTAIQGQTRRVDETPHEVVLQLGTARLLRYRSDTPASVRVPVVICYALVNRPYILDLQPARSVVRQLLQRGLEVFVIDWGAPTPDDQGLRLSDYVNVRLREMVEYVGTVTGSPDVNLMGYCMGGTLSAMFTCLHPRLVRNLILLAAPIDFSGDECLLHLWTQPKYFDVDRIVDTFGNCPPLLLQTAFQLMKPVANFLQKYADLVEHVGDEEYVKNFVAVERWVNDGVPVAGETFREFVKWFYQENRLVRGELQLDNQPLTLSQITCPLLLLTADFDHLVHPSSTLRIGSHVSSREIQRLSVPVGHVGLVVSSKAHQTLWPAAANWISEVSSESV